ncbi:MAG TPA: FIST N-terminal domain-containing protein [Mycobacteriales bacterium]|nr:FIST N-terminal domain-containing protein [Mycobacteriales bacterium]
MSRFGDGLATGPDVVAAAVEATERALAPLGGRLPDLVCAFVAGADPDAVATAGVRVAERSGAAAMLGCSAGGVLAGGSAVEGRGAAAVWAAVLPSATVRTFHLEVMTGGATAAVLGLPPPAAGDDELVLLLADPWSFPADGFVAQANTALPGVPVVGGLASGAAAAGGTRLFVDGRVVDRGAVGALITGSGSTALVSQGFRAVGPPMTVTASAGNVVRSLAGRRAVDKVEQVVAELPPVDQALASAGLQLGVAMDEYADDADYVARSVLGVERDTGGLVVGDVVPVGRTVRLQVRDADAADADLRSALARYRATTRDVPAGGALLFTCNGRGAHLFGASHGGADHDPALVHAELATQGLAGFFAAGELGPVGGRNHLHGFTASLLAFPG